MLINGFSQIVGQAPLTADASSALSMVVPYYSNVRPEILAFVPWNAANVLEIGCGAGNFGAALKRDRGAKTVIGIEIDETAANATRLQLDSVLIGDAFAVLPQLQGQQFDVVVLNDVLEHMVTPEDLL